MLDQEVQFAGPITLAFAVGVFALLAILFGWLLWRERLVIGSGWAIAFWVLRLLVPAVVLWMMLGPTAVKRQPGSDATGVAILVDASASMHVVDKLSPQEVAPWLALSHASDSARALAAADQTLVATQLSLERVRDLNVALVHQAGATTITRIGTAITTGIERAARDWQTALTAMNSEYPDLTERGKRIHADVMRAETEADTTVRRAMRSIDAESVHDLAEAVDTLEDDLTQLERRTAVWLRDVKTQLAGLLQTPHATSKKPASRHDLAVETLNGLETQGLNNLDARVSVSRFTFSDDLVPTDETADWKTSLNPPAAPANASSEGKTDLSTALEKLRDYATGHAVKAAFVYSDGAHNAAHGSTPEDVAARLTPMKVYVVASGSPAPSRDVLVHRAKAPRLVSHHDSIILDSVVTATACSQEQTELVLKHNGKVIERRALMFSEDQIDEPLTFTSPADTLGPQAFELSVSPLDGESSLENNSTTLRVDVIQDKLRLLVVDHSARWEYRYLEQLFRRDNHIACDTLLFAPDLVSTGDLPEGSALPTQLDDWARYQVVILGDLETRHFDKASQQSLVEFVRDRGGNVVVIAGDHHLPADYRGQPLLDLLPVQQRDGRVAEREGFVPRITPEGASHPVALIEDRYEDAQVAWSRAYASLPFRFLSEYSRAKPAAHTILEAVSAESVTMTRSDSDPHVLMAWHQVGAGRVAYLSSPSTWQLRNRRGDRLHHRFWGQLLRWITSTDRSSGTDRVKIATDRGQYDSAETAEVSVRLADDHGTPVAGAAIQVLAVGPNSTEVVLDLTEDEKVAGRYVGALSELKPGTYQLSPQGPVIQQLLAGNNAADDVAIRITVTERRTTEMSNTRCNRPLLERIAKSTGGRIISPAAVPEVIRLETLDHESAPIERRTPLWNRWRYLWLVLGCLCTEWVVRKSKGLF